MVTSEWPSDKVPDRAPFVVRQVEALRSAGVHVDVVALRGRKNPFNYLKAWGRVRRILRQDSHHLVHAQWAQSGLLAIPKRTPLVVTIRGKELTRGAGRTGWIGPLLGWLHWIVTRAVLTQADRVVVVARFMVGRLPCGTPYHVIPSGVDLDLFRPLDKYEARRELGIAPSGLYVLFGGRPGVARKRFALAEQTIEVVRRTRSDVELLIADGVPPERMPLYMNASDALLLTSSYEGSPNVVKEALACNLPVVTVEVGDVAERLHGLEDSLVCTDDSPEALGEALSRVLEAGSKGSGRSVVEELDERRLTREVLGVYRLALERAGRDQHLLE
jgi:glycosyltransferase involved in cell wall biosynthesis